MRPTPEEELLAVCCMLSSWPSITLLSSTPHMNPRPN